MRGKRFILLTATLTVAIVFTLIVSSSSRGSVRYHVDRLAYLRHLDYLPQPRDKDAPSELDSKGRPVHLADYLRFRTWRWYWRGGLDITKFIQEQKKHQQALIQLGYYERREFTLTNRAIDPQLLTMITNGVLTESVWMHMDDSKPKWLRVTARKVDMPTVERSVATFDTSKK